MLRVSILVSLTLLLGSLAPAQPAKLPDNLLLHLDASAQANAIESLEAEMSLEHWEDASGSGISLSQSDSSHQPKLMRIGDGTDSASYVVRFDGQDDFLQTRELGKRLRSMTLFMVAAPHSNAGNYRGLLSFNEHGRRDYESGFNIDLGPGASVSFDCLNLEGPGFGGARDLMPSTFPFGTLHLIEVTVDESARQINLRVDNEPQGSRPLDPSTLVADQLTIGARYYNNSPGPQHADGFLDGDIAEVLVFDRVLNDSERELVSNHLDQKYASLKKALPRTLASDSQNQVLLQTVDDPPPVQMLVPGFAIHELPLELTNINNLRYRNDGKLYALAYKGEIWLLDDRDGDRLEDSKQLFFDGKNHFRGPIGMAVIPPGHALLETESAQGVVLASKGKVSAVIDVDGDDVADSERIIAQGWQEIPQSVDAVGIAIDADGAIYFGLGTANYANGYLVDDQGESQFDLDAVHGTIQKIHPDLSKRETVCTGVRFTIGMAMGPNGELFVTDQEGATWLPNGNPFDELLMIRPGLHYGFPPRHPRHLPNVFDQPSLFDYGPQHQSTCGMAFNLPFRSGGPVFGPDHWRGDVLVTGESRGKLYRTSLTKTDDGNYIADNQLISCLSMLTVDCCVSPHGDLLIACHSGGPDWGTGPSGIGKIFCVRYVDQVAPQPVSIHVPSPQQVHIRFDRPLDPNELSGLLEETEITYGRYVSAGDRFESIRPGYAVTNMQIVAPRYRLPIYSYGVTEDLRTLVFSTAPHDAAVNYAIKLPRFSDSIKSKDNGLPQHPTIDLAYSPHGVAAEWKSATDDEIVTGWLPHLDVELASSLSPQANEILAVLDRPGTLTLSTQMDAVGLFHPAVQPGSTLDYEAKEDTWIDEASIQLSATRSTAVLTDQVHGVVLSSNDDKHRLSVVTREPDLIPVRLTLKTGKKVSSELAWSVTTAGGGHHSGPINPSRLWMPNVNREPGAMDAQPSLEKLAGASWGRGRRVFFSQEAGCAKCHVADANGHRIGPDLANLVHRDYESVRRDISQPSFAINPDFVTYILAIDDGRVLTGTLLNDNDHWLIADQQGNITRIAKDRVEVMKPSSKSIMPDGIVKLLGPAKTNDLLAYLMLPAPHMPRDAQLPPPPPRTRDEVAAILAGSTEPDKLEPINILLVAGEKDHGPGEHDYPAWLDMWSELMLGADGVNVETAMEWPTDEQIEWADTILFFQKGSWNDQRAQAIDAHLDRGGGLIYIHWAVEGGAQAPEFAKRIGLASEAAKLRYRHGPLELGFRGADGHPIARNFDRVNFYDESYWLMQGDRSRIEVIATGVEDGEPRPLFWTLQPSRGRVFVSIPGHYSWTFDDPLFRVLLLRATAWTANQPVDRFNDLVTLGVKLGETAPSSR